MTVNGIAVDDWVYQNPNTSRTDATILQEMEDARRWAGIGRKEWDAMYGDPFYTNPFKNEWSKAQIIIMRRREIQAKTIQGDLEYRANKKQANRNKPPRRRR